MLSIIVAIGNNNVIGGNNDLLWHLPADLKKFKEITMSGSKTMIMGRKTFQSLPSILPGRKHIILTSNPDFKIDNENVEVVSDIETIKAYSHSEEEYFVIGGGQIYELLLPYTSKLYITRIYSDFNGDTFFPKWDESQWKVINENDGILDDKNRYKYKRITYIKSSDS